jgi:hypothetical protein
MIELNRIYNEEICLIGETMETAKPFLKWAGGKNVDN